MPDLSTSKALLILMSLSQILVILGFLFREATTMDWSHFGLVTIFVQWQALSSALLLSSLRHLLQDFSEVKALWIAWFFLLILAAGINLLVQWITPFTLPPEGQAFSWAFLTKHTLISAIVMGIALHYMYLQKSLLSRQKAELHNELLALQARIRPHFLFNCLNSIASLIHESPDTAEEMIVDLSELLQSGLREGVMETDIQEEWQLCEHYLRIESKRLGGRLFWQCNFDALDDQLGIPNLTLQPIIENAIYYGIQPNPDPGNILVFGKNHGKQVEITVSNSQAPRQQPANGQGHHMALTNIRQRLAKLYGKSASLKQHSNDKRYTVVLSYTTN